MLVRALFWCENDADRDEEDPQERDGDIVSELFHGLPPFFDPGGSDLEWYRSSPSYPYLRSEVGIHCGDLGKRA